MSNDLDTALLAINADSVLAIHDLMDPSLLADNRKFGLFFWELPSFPQAWARAADSLDEVWVATRFVKDSLAAVITKPIRIMPIPISLNSRDPAEARRALGLPLDRLLYLTVFDYNSFPQRKNPIAAIRAFLDAFAEDTPSGPMLIVKCHGFGNRDPWEGQIAELCASASHIRLIDQVFSAEDLLRLQAACDVYVSLHRSEGFGLNLAECMAAGKLVIATDFSGNCDFMDATNSLPIGYRMIALTETDYPHASGQWWADPDHDAAVAALRSATGSEIRQRLGLKARRDIADRFSDSIIGAMMKKSLG